MQEIKNGIDRTHHYNKADIIKELNTFRTSNQKLMNEVTKTINRLKSQNR